VRVERGRLDAEDEYCLLGLRNFVFIVPLTEPVRFGWGLVGFRFLKPKPNRTELFLKKNNRFNRFVFSVRFFGYFFLSFLGLISFLIFLLTFMLDPHHLALGELPSPRHLDLTNCLV
jgi:hypothetical protein